jgi:agmatine deiminase
MWPGKTLLVTRTLSSTPLADGFYLPAEAVPHARAWLLWPERGDVWREDARPAQRAFAEVARAIADAEAVTVGASRRQLETARALLPSDVQVIELPSDDAWMRDVAPSFVVNANGEVRGVDWRFNAWGGLYASWQEDERVAPRLLKRAGLLRYEAPLVLEGGAVCGDGAGTLMVVEACVLDERRNPGVRKGDVERVLKDYLGASAVIWLGRGLVEDETGGHVDNLACYARPGLVLLAWTDDSADPQYAVVREALAQLERARDACGRSVEIAKVPLPPPLFRTREEALGVVAVSGSRPRKAGDRLPATYVNAYVANGAVILPALDPATDEKARAIFAHAFPDREVKMVPAREILLGGGGIHCITREQPLGSALLKPERA